MASGISCITDSVTENESINVKDKVSQKWLFFTGNCGSVMKFLASRRYNSRWAPLKFLDALFRGYGQVVFANNPISGILIFISLMITDPFISLSGLFTAVVGLMASITAIIPDSPEQIEQGLTTYNSLLIGLITAATLPAYYGIELIGSKWFFMAVASIISVYVASAINKFLKYTSQNPISCLTFPFNIVQSLLFLALVSMDTLNARNSVVTTEFISTYDRCVDVSNISNSLALNETHVMTQNHLILPQCIQHNNSETEEHTKLRSNNNNLLEFEDKLDATRHLHEKSLQNLDVENTTKSYLSAVSDIANEEKLMSTNSFNQYIIPIEKNNTTLQNETRDLSPASDHNTTNISLNWGRILTGIVLSMVQVFASHFELSSVLIYLAVFIYSPIMAGFALLGATVGTLTGILLSDPNTYASVGGVYDGSWGFNGLLCSICLVCLSPVVNLRTAVSAVFSAIFATVIYHISIQPLSQANLPPMSWSFNISSLIFLYATWPVKKEQLDIKNISENHCEEYRKINSQDTEESTPLTSDLTNLNFDKNQKSTFPEIV